VAQAKIQGRKKQKGEQKREEKTPTHFSANVNGGLSFSCSLCFSKGKLIL